MSDERTTRRRVSLGRALAKGFRNSYDSLGYIVFATFAAFIAVSIMFSIGVFAARAMRPGMVGMLLFVPAALVAYIAAAGVFYYANRSVFGEHPVPGDTFAGMKLLLLPALKMFAVDLIISVVLIGDAVFFFARAGAEGAPIFAALGILCGYLTLVWLMMAMYHLPLLAAQLDMESGPHPGVILRKSFLLTADNPGFTVGLFLVIIALAVVCVLLAFVGMALLFLGVGAFLLTTALRDLFIKYGIVEDEPEIVEDRWNLPTSWLKREGQDGSSNERVGGKIDG